MKEINLKKRILVLGGTGFIGKRLVEKLQEQGRLVNLLVYDKIPDFASQKNITIYKGDLADKKTIIDAVKNSDIIVNLVGTFNEDIFYLLNIVSSANLLDVCKTFGHLEKLIFISSEAVYGDYINAPHKENDALNPVTEYGFSKYLAEEVYRFYNKKYKIPVIILRLANTYGPGHRIGVISESINSAINNQPVKLHKDGQQRRDFLYVDDAAVGIIESIDYIPNSGYDIFNITGNKAYSLIEMVSLIERAMKKKIEIDFMPPKLQDIRHMEADYQKAKTALGYDPKVSLEEGIIKTIGKL